MKRFPLLFVLLLIASTCFSQVTIPNDWKLSPKQAAKMMEYFSDCTGECPSSTATPDTAKENLIKLAFPNAKSFSWVNARYRDEDVQRYAARNAKLARAGGASVSGYTTRILQVVDQSDEVHFFDIAAICPPPSICDAAAERDN